MSKSLEEQIGECCVHFTGIQNTHCSLGISYESVRQIETKPYKFPCLLNTLMSGGNCAKAEFPTDEAIASQVSAIRKRGAITLASFTVIHQMTDNEGTIPCTDPDCKEGVISYRKLKNGNKKHIWAKCNSCELSFGQ